MAAMGYVQHKVANAGRAVQSWSWSRSLSAGRSAHDVALTIGVRGALRGWILASSRAMHHAGDMTRIVLVLALVCVAGAVNGAEAGELADLHRALAKPRPGVEAPRESGGGAFRPLVPLVAPPDVPDIERVGLERGPCFVGCPVFTLIVERDGSFRYAGEQGVARLGEHHGTVDRGTLALLFRFVDEIGFMALDDTYESGYLDAPSTFTMVEWRGTTKVVLNYGGAAPARVWALERLLEGLLQHATWNDPEP